MLPLQTGVLRRFSLVYVLGLTCFAATDWMVDAAEKSGLDFVHFNGMTGQFFIAEVIGSGAAVFDYDRDGDLDVYLVQGAMMGPDTYDKALFPLKNNAPPRDRLFRNDLEVTPNGKRILRFTDVTAKSGIDATGAGMGVAVGDVDGDGFPDLYVTQFGPDQLWRNKGDGTFENITQKAGPLPKGWSTSATFFDFDRDGDADLFVCNYLKYNHSLHKSCSTAAGVQDYCGPKTYEPVPDSLFENTGGGVFRDVTSRLGIHKAFGAGLGVVAADFNGDGWQDLFVANDGAANQLWINQQGGGFVDEGLLAGCGLNADGNPEASMGVAVADYDDDGDRDLFLTHLRKETNTLYVNDGQGWFEDRTIVAGLGAPSTGFTAFGTGWLDVDNDGLLDLLSLNGTVQIIESLRKKKDPYPLHQPNQLFLNRGKKGFEEVSHQAGVVFKASEVSRGAAFGDLDNDGDGDVIVTNNNGPVRLLRNELGQNKTWLGVVPRGTDNRIVLGVSIALALKDGGVRWRWSHTDGSYLCASDPRAVFGLGNGTKPLHVTLTWPDGVSERWPVSKTQTYLDLKRGTGTRIQSPASP